MSDQKRINPMLDSLKASEERTVVTVAAPAPATAVVPDKVEEPVEQLKRMTMIVSVQLHTRLKMHAVAKRIHLEDVYREALADYASKHGIA